MGTSLQQIGLQYTTAGKTGFITSFYILIIPFLTMFFLKHKIDLLTWISIIIGFIGLYLLAVPSLSDFSINKGDFIVFLGSFCWGGHILIIDYYSKKVSPVELSFLQFVILTILSGICAFLFENETATLSNIFLSWKSIVYAGFLSSGIAYTLQMVGQKYTNPIVASLILSLEAVFAALAGYFMLDEVLTSREFFGCSIVFLAIIFSQISKDIFKKKYNEALKRKDKREILIIHGYGANKLGHIPILARNLRIFLSKNKDKLSYRLSINPGVTYVTPISRLD